MGVTAVVVAYEGGAMLDRCLKALLDSRYRALDVVLVDNGGSDRAAARWRGRGDGRITTVGLGENRGFAGGVNAGIARAETTLPDRARTIYALVNQDCIVDPGWLGPLVAVLCGDPEIAVAGARLYDPDHRTIQHAGALIAGNGLTSHRGRGSRVVADFAEQCDVDYVTGALCAFRAEVWHRFGPLDAGYHPAYYEEADFCVRARRAAMRVVYVPECEAIHAEASSLGAGSRAFLQAYHRNRIRFAARHLLHRGAVGGTLRSELAWLAGRRSLAELAPALRAYARLPGDLRAARRERGRSAS